MVFFTEWYLTVFAGRYWTFSDAKDKLWLSVAYFCFVFSLAAVVPTNKKRFLGLLYGLLTAMVLIQFIRAGIIVNPYEKLLNISTPVCKANARGSAKDSGRGMVPVYIRTVCRSSRITLPSEIVIMRPACSAIVSSCVTSSSVWPYFWLLSFKRRIIS